ncbi:hypothetical protein vseg_019204 [Gypsophila vaccaria]
MIIISSHFWYLQEPNMLLSFIHKLQSLATPTISKIALHPNNGTVNRRLLNLIDITSPPSSSPINGVITSDHTLDVSRQLWFRLFVPLDDHHHHPLPVIIYFHGGGFVLYSASTAAFDDVCRHMAARSSAVVISVNYRLAPEHKFPAQYEDGFDIVKFIDSEMRDKVAEFPAAADLGRCFLAGDSSGGNLAHHVALRCAGFVFKEVKICGLVMTQPFFGGEMRTDSETRLGNDAQLKKMDFYWKAFLPNGSNRDHPAVNVFGSENSEDTEAEAEAIVGMDFPDTIVFIGGLDLLQDRQRRYVNGLKKCGKNVHLVEYPNVLHGLSCAPHCPEYQLLIAQVSDFVLNHATSKYQREDSRSPKS